MPAYSSCLKKGRWVVDHSDRFGRGGTRTAIGGCILEHRDRKLNHYDLPTKWVQLHEVCHAKMDARFFISVRNLPHDLCPKSLPCVSIMTDKSKQPKRRDGAILSLDVAIGLVNIGKEASSMTPAPAVFGVATILLTTIRVSLIPCRERDVQAQT